MKVQFNIQKTAETAATPRRKRRLAGARPDAERSPLALPGIKLEALSPHAARANLPEDQSQSASARAATAHQLLRQAAALPPIPLPHRAALEAHFERPLGSIAVYANPLARTALHLLDAEAAAYDSAIFLAEPRPSVAILAHEVIHVLQARQETHTAAPASANPIAPDHPAEREAASLAEYAGVLDLGQAPLAVRAQLPPRALALRRTAIPTPQTAATPETLPRRAERPRPESTVTPEPPNRAAPQRQATEENAPPAGASETAPVELPPALAPGISADAVAARQVELTQTETALQQADSPEALVAAFAAAPPTLKAQRAATLGEQTDQLARAEQSAFNAELPAIHAELHSQAEPAAPLSVTAPETRAVTLEPTTPPPAPEPEIAPTADLGRYTANAGIATDVSRLLSGEPENRAGQVAERLHDIRTSDSAIDTSPGALPRVPLEGVNDPARIEAQNAAGIDQARQARDAAQQAVLNGPGPEEAQPIAMDETYAVGELQQPEISAPPPAAGPQAYLDLGLPSEVQVAFDQQQQAAMQASLADARTQVDDATVERNHQRDEAVAIAQQEAQQQSQQADEQQRAGVADARDRIQSARQETLDAQQAAVADLETEAESRRAADRASLAERVQTDEQQVAQRYDQAETAARAEVVAGEQRAETARRNAERDAEEQSWWDRAVDFVRSAFEALTSLIGEIFDAVRATVHAVLDAAKAFAEAVIDAAAAFVNSLITAFGAFLQSLVTALLGDIFPELAAALNAAIDEAVAFTQSVVSAAADMLRAGIAALVEGLRAGLNAIINAYQAAVQLALAAVQAALSGDWAALARMALEAVLQVAGIDPESFYAFIGRAQETFQLILDDPAGFVGNLVDAFLAGVRNFSANFLTHLQAGIIGWLTGAIGGAGITIPERFDLMGVLSLVQQILGLTWERLRERAVRLIGETAVGILEFVADYLRTLIEGGWEALWQRIQDDLASLRDLVLDNIKNFLLERIVTAAITRLATMFNPVGAIVNLILAAYNLFTFLRDQLARIIEVVQTVINAIGDIARGVIQPAAQRVEDVLARLLPLAIDLLARLLGLGNVGARVREIIEQVRGVVDRAIDGLIERVRGLFRGGGATTGAVETTPARAAGQPADEPFQLGRERHTLRGQITGRRLTILMASNGWLELEGRIANIRRVYITGTGDRRGLMHATPSLARQLDQRLEAIENVALQVIRDAEAAPDEPQRVVITNAGLDRIEALFTPLGGPPFFIETEGNTQPPTHRYSPVSTDSYGRAVGAVGDPISSASRGQGSPASVDPPGLGILRGVAGAPAYERGHVLAGTSDNSLGGPGNDIRNLAPISPATNVAMRDGPERQARDAIYDATVYPPNVLRYVARCRYRDISGLESWLTGTLGATAGSAVRLYALARANTDLNAANVHDALGGAAQLPLTTVTANLDAIRRHLAYYFLAQRIDIAIESLQGATAVTPNHPINNHQGVTLP